ncbi:MAG: hypothetical protein WC959_05570 [Kiritimatiellales bacterium]
MNCATGDLLAWGHSNAVKKVQRSKTKAQEKDLLTQRVNTMKIALTEIRVIHTDRFKEMFGWSERTCRAIVAASDGEVIATTSGYILNRRATVAEFHEANGRIYSQARNMLQRAIRERAVRHQLVNRHA